MQRYLPLLAFWLVIGTSAFTMAADLTADVNPGDVVPLDLIGAWLICSMSSFVAASWVWLKMGDNAPDNAAEADADDLQWPVLDR